MLSPLNVELEGDEEGDGGPMWKILLTVEPVEVEGGLKLEDDAVVAPLTTGS